MRLVSSKPNLFIIIIIFLLVRVMLALKLKEEYCFEDMMSYHMSYIYIDCCSISNNPKCLIGRAYIQTVMDERITLCEYTTQSFMFYEYL